MSQLYFYTLRDVRVEGDVQFPGLFPKLYSHLDDHDLTLDDLFNYNQSVQPSSQKKWFEGMMMDPGSSLNQSKYIHKEDIPKLIGLNLSYFDETNMKKKEYERFIEHLLKAHTTMEYGLYFGARKANSEKEFMDSMNIANPRDKSQTLVYYTNVEKLLDHVDEMREKLHLKSQLLYFNMGWNYGVRDENSAVYTGENRYDFICKMRSFSNEELEMSETVCQIPLPVELFNFTFRNLSHNTFKGGRKKTKKKKKSLKEKHKLQKNRNEAKKYIDVLNFSLQHIHSDKKLIVFTKEDELLWTSGYLKRGIKKGWENLQNKDVILEMDCHSLCMVVSILNYEILSKKFEKLTTLEKLYLFFLSYVLEEEKKMDVSFYYALRKTNIRIKIEEKKYKIYLHELGVENPRTKQIVKNIKRLGKRKEELIEENINISSGKERPKYLQAIYRLNKCNNIDCEYLHEYQMGKTEQHFKTYGKFCKHLTFMFKGVIWMNMCLYFGGFRTISQIDSPKKILNVNFGIRELMSGPMKKNIILVPTHKMYADMNLYSLEEKDRLFHKGIVKLWVYCNLDIRKKTIEKVEVSLLDDRKYIVAALGGDETSVVNTSNRGAKQVIDDFVNGKGKLPRLTQIKKFTTKLGGIEVKTLDEVIVHTITEHWLVMHPSKLNDFITNIID